MIWYNNIDATDAMRHRLVEEWHGKSRDGRSGRSSRGLRLAALADSTER